MVIAINSGCYTEGIFPPNIRKRGPVGLSHQLNNSKHHQSQLLSVMATSNPPPPGLTSQTSISIESLRSQAQSHLEEISQSLAAEHLSRLTKDAELQKYAKRKPSPAQSIPETKGPRLRPASDVLDRLKHDSALDASEYHVGYLERFDGVLEMPVTQWVRESTDEDFIPQHRIRWIKRRRQGEEDVVWSRDERIDRIFGSGNGNGNVNESGG